MADAYPWVYLCKPVRAPFRDGTSVLVRNLLRGLPSDVPAVYFGDPDAPVRSHGDRVVPAASMDYEPSLTDKAKMVVHLAGPELSRLPIHSFFAPNRSSSLALEVLRRFPRRRRVLQTLPASTGAARVADLLGRLDGVVVTSDWGRDQLLAGGVAKDRVTRIYPGVEVPADGAADLAQRRTVLYAGDLDDEVGQRLVAVAHALEGLEGWCLEIAARPKAQRDAAVRQTLGRVLERAIAAGRVKIMGEVADMPTLFGRTAMQLYLASHARNKVDIPFALLEGMASGVPVALLDAAPVNELVALGARHGLQGCVPLRPADLGADLQHLREVLAEPTQLSALGRQARQLVVEHFSASAMSAHYRRKYESLS